MSQIYKKISYVLLTIFTVLTLSEGVSVNEVFGRYFGDTNYTRSEAEVSYEIHKVKVMMIEIWIVSDKV